MKRYLLLLLLLGILFGVLYGQPNPDRVYLSLFDAHEYTMNMTMSTEANRLYANVEFSVDSALLQEAENYCFFLSKKILLERVKINGKSVPFSYTTGLDARHFEPPLEDEMLLSPEAPVFCISIDKKHLQKEKGEIIVYLEYRSFLPDWNQDEQGRKYLLWNTADFIYPRNILKDTVLNLNFTCTPYYVLVNAESPTYRGGIRTYTREFREKAGSGNNIKVFKS